MIAWHLWVTLWTVLRALVLDFSVHRDQGAFISSGEIAVRIRTTFGAHLLPKVSDRRRSGEPAAGIELIVGPQGQMMVGRPESYVGNRGIHGPLQALLQMHLPCII